MVRVCTILLLVVLCLMVVYGRHHKHMRHHHSLRPADAQIRTSISAFDEPSENESRSNEVKNGNFEKRVEKDKTSNPKTDPKGGADGSKSGGSGGADSGGKSGTEDKEPKNDKEVKDDSDSIKDEIAKLNVVAFTGTSTAKVKGGVDTSLKGIEEFYDNYKKKDKLGMVISVVTVFSGIASIVGGPIGNIVAMSLNILNAGLRILKKEKRKPAESESDKLEKVIKRALKEFRETQLKAEWSGYERLADLYMKNVEFVDAFNDKKTLEELTQQQQEAFAENGMGSLGDVKQTMFETVTPNIYEILMSGSSLLGKVEFEISQICDMELQMNKVKSKYKLFKGYKEKIEPPTEEEEKEKEKFAKSCLGIYELYAKINFYREQNFLKALNVINKIIRKKVPEWFKWSSDKTEASKRKAFVYMELLLDVIQNSNEGNKKIFRPLVSPFHNFKMRYTVNYYQTYSSRYEYLTAYMKALYFKNEESRTEILNDVMFCNQYSLLGSCNREVMTGDSKDVPFNAEKTKWKSVYVPEGKTIKVTYKDTGSNNPIKLVGPGTMGSLYNILKKENLVEVTNPVTKIAISKSENLREKSTFKMCVAMQEYGNEGSPDYHKSVCTTPDFDADFLSFPLNAVQDRILWKGNYISIESKEPDLAFIGTASVKTKSGKILKVRWGPFFSPRRMTSACGSALWDGVSVYKYKDSDTSTVTKYTDVEFCKGNNNILCEDGIIDKSFFVTICKQPGLKGHCEDIPLIRGKASKVVRLTRINGYVEVGGADKTHAVEELEKEEVILPNNKKIEGKDTKEYPFNEKIDSCIWMPRKVAHSGDFVMKNLLASMKIPAGLSVELYTGENGSGTMFGPYDGPVTVDRIDGNDVNSDVINSLKIIEK